MFSFGPVFFCSVWQSFQENCFVLKKRHVLEMCLKDVFKKMFNARVQEPFFRKMSKSGVSPLRIRVQEPGPRNRDKFTTRVQETHSFCKS